jgi:hypothetical protein
VKEQHQGSGLGGSPLNKSGTSSTPQEVTVEERQHPPAGSVTVEERTRDLTMRSLADLYAERGFFENRTVEVGWDEYHSFKWSAGTVSPILARSAAKASRSVRPSVALPGAADTAADNATAAVQHLRPRSRSLAGHGGDPPARRHQHQARDLTTVEYQTLQLNQVATDSSGIPRIHAAQPMFQSL